MPTDPARIAAANRRTGALIVEELGRHGIGVFFLSPGARSAPLALAAAEHRSARTVVHTDERGAAYCALGWARATGHPAVLVCTSGTAAANYFPAIVEASMSGVPLIVLTADRPPEVVDTGANQTIRQAGLYGPYARWESTLLGSDDGVPPEAILTTIDQAVCRATHAPAGPVHINCAFREPLVPEVPPCSGMPVLNEPALRGWVSGHAPYTTYSAPERRPGTQAHQALLCRATQTERGLLVLGRLSTERDAEAALALAQALNWPVFADIGSGLRLGTAAAPFVPYYDLLLSSPEMQAFCRPEIVLHIGGPVTSKHVARHWEMYPPAMYWMVAEHPFRQDPHHRVTHRFEADVAPFCEWLAACANPVPVDGWLTRLRAGSEVVHRAIETCMARADVLSEPEIARIVSREIAPDGALFLGNSMPVRHMDLFAASDGPRVRVMSNRGASGIDGCVASAAGFSLGTGMVTTAVLGDLAALHDLNSLALLKRARIILIVINNDGGGIFSHLPMAAYTEHFDSHFAVPHGLCFSDAAKMFGLAYQMVSGRAAFVDAYRAAQTGPASSIIEVRTSRGDGVAVHRALRDAAVAAIADAVP